MTHDYDNQSSSSYGGVPPTDLYSGSTTTTTSGWPKPTAAAPCPSCGYCPSCGRSNPATPPTSPWQYQPSWQHLPYQILCNDNGFTVTTAVGPTFS